MPRDDSQLPTLEQLEHWQQRLEITLHELDEAKLSSVAIHINQSIEILRNTVAARMLDE